MTAHAGTHKRGGNDPIRLDDLAEPQDNVDLDANTLRHGLLPKLSGSSSDVLKGDGTFGTGGGASTSAHYVTTEAEAGLSAEFNLGSLTTGLLKHSVSAGVSTPATASAGTDYVAPGAITSSGLTQATGKLLGRTTASSGAVEEIAVGSGLTFAAGSLSASVAGTLLGLTAYAAGSDGALHTQSTNTMTDMDATNASVTFTAPASGNVLVRLSVLTQSSSSGDHYFGLKESTTTVAVCYAVGTGAFWNGGGGNGAARATIEIYLTGLSAGSHTYKAAHRVTAGSASVYTGPNFGQIIIEVWAAP